MCLVTLKGIWKNFFNFCILYFSKRINNSYTEKMCKMFYIKTELLFTKKYNNVKYSFSDKSF